MTALNNLISNQNHLYSIPLSEIRTSSLNFYESCGDTDESLEALRTSIRENGQITPIEVFRIDDDLFDYEISSGNTRFKAICKNFEDGFGDGTIKAVILNESLSEEEKLERITAANAQRKKSDDQLAVEIQVYDKMYRKVHDSGDYHGTKDKFVSEHIGMSERWVRDFRRKLREAEQGSSSESNSTENTASTSTASQPKTKADLVKKLKSLKKAAGKAKDLSLEVSESDSENGREIVPVFNNLSAIESTIEYLINLLG